MSKIKKIGIVLSFLCIVCTTGVFAIQQTIIVNTGKISDPIDAGGGKYIYIKNNNTGNAIFVPYTDTAGITYGCPATNSNRTTWKFSNVYSDTTKVISGGKSIGPNRGVEISCGCTNPDFYKTVITGNSVPHNRSGDLYDTEQVAAGDTCASHKLHVLCDNGNISDTLGTHIYPTCLEAPQATCALKRFLKGVSSGTVTYSKVRNAMASASTTETSQIPPYASGYSLGYGELLGGVNYGYTRTSTSLAGEYIIRSPIYGVASDRNTSYTRYISQIELYGVTLSTEGTNRGCIGDTGYWVTSNVRSHQTTTSPNGFQYTGAGATAFKTRPSLVDFEIQDCSFEPSLYVFTPGISLGSKVYASELIPMNCTNPTIRKGNTAYGCQAELLPNPDLYCVEKVNNNGKAKAMFTTLYFKEFTKSYPGSVTCSAITAVPGKTFKLMTKEDFGGLTTGYQDPGYASNSSERLVRYDRTIINTVSMYSSRIGGTYSPSIPYDGVLSYSSDARFSQGNLHASGYYTLRGGQTGYKYTAQPLFTPTTAIFGKFVFDNPGSNVNGRYLFGANTPVDLTKVIKIPLANSYGFYMMQEDDSPSVTYIATGLRGDFGTTTYLTKNVCYSYEPTCLPGYKFQTGVVGKYGDGCQPITPIPCVDESACGPGAKCIGYQSATTAGCTGTNGTIGGVDYTNICSRSSVGANIGSTAISINPTAQSACSTNGYGVVYKMVRSSIGGNYLAATNIASIATSYSGNLNAFCKQATKYPSSMYVGYTAALTSLSSAFDYMNLINGGATSSIYNTTSNWYPLATINCTYGSTQTVACSSLSVASCASAGCTATSNQSEVMGQCSR